MVAKKEESKEIKEVKKKAKVVKERNPRNVLLKTIESKTKVLNYWRDKYLVALDEVRQARDTLISLVEENEPTSQREVNAHQQNFDNQAESKTEQGQSAATQNIPDKMVNCLHCKVQKPSKEMNFYPASMTYRCDDCKKILEEELLRSQEPEKEPEKPALFKSIK